MGIIEINQENINILKKFIGNELPNSFRYFSSRTIECISNHKITIIFLDDIEKNPIGYGHLDDDNLNIWLGICVLPKYHGMGIGNKIMKYLVQKAKDIDIKKINLTVDIDNIIAKKLYEKMGFKIFKKTEEFYHMFLVV